MLEQEAWSIKADNVLHLGNSKSTNEASDDKSLPPSGELSSKESILSDKIVAICDSVGHQHQSPQADGISFFDESWDGLGNFEDVDRMFRSWDSTFGLGTSQENDLGWLSSSDAIGKSEDVLKSDFKFSCPGSVSQKSMSESDDTSISNGMTYSINESEVKNSSAIFKGSGQLGVLYFPNRISDCGGMDKKDKIDERIRQMKLQNQTANHRNGQYVGHSTLFYAADVPEAGLQSKKAPETHPFEYLQSDITFMSSDFSFSIDQTSLYPAQSVIKSENSHLTPVTSNDSYTSNQRHSIHEASSLQVISLESGENGELMDRPKKSLPSSNGIPKSMTFSAQVSMPAIISNEKPIHYSSKIHSDEVNLKIHQELGFSVAQDSSTSFGLHDISLEATSFRQLQLVMDQLDVRAKLCIRDSLYRLAQSAEQRHQFVKLNGGTIGDDSVLARRSTKFPDLMDIETDTNPIDRSIAHLLFHRPAESPLLAGGYAMSFN